ncbi:hypothetical protein STCU_00115 [Strigomonas culicis]|uniref:Uncharacterized protein n=1 Tax=Strigomonas culicis TaxID=28005 RepID=S9V269_9TRYP|nr:hypothetical protein STCU_00115 [Strigomonas culicis]|eukprot:EPY37182.1 hypothetical protein STCU_00115 [Strigomonas culicis]
MDAVEMLEEWMEDTTGVDVEKLKERAHKRKEEMDEWRWRSTAIAFAVGTIVTAASLRMRP